MKNNYSRFSGEELKKLVTDTPQVVKELDSMALSKLMNHETDLLCQGKGDMELIKKCSDLLDEKRAVDKWEQSFDKALGSVSRDSATERKTWRGGFKRFSTVAATIAIMITVSTFIVSAYVIESIYGNDDSFVLFHNETVREYASFKEMVESESLDIMYPTKMPKGVDVTCVTLEDKGNGKRELRVTTSDKETNIVIQIAMGQGLQLQGNIGNHIVDGCNYYVFGDTSHYYAFCYYKDDYYSFQAGSYDDLMFIIENMEK